jgi:hypothetical protein
MHAMTGVSTLNGAVEAAMVMATVTVTVTAAAAAMDRTVKEVKRSFLRQGRRAEESSEWVTNLPAN